MENNKMEAILIISLSILVIIGIIATALVETRKNSNQNIIEVQIQQNKSGYPYLAERNGEVFIILNDDFGIALNTDKYGKRLHYSECLPDSLEKTDKKILISNR